MFEDVAAEGVRRSWRLSGGVFGIEGRRAAQYRRRYRDGGGWVIAVFGASNEDALDGAVVRIPDGERAGAGRVHAGVTVFLPQSDDSLDGAQSVDGA